MSAAPVMSITDELVAELEAAANAFPDYDWDSNETPFFNGPSGESLGGEPTGLYCVYGQAFEIDGETYDGPTLVAACPYAQAKFICDAKPAIKLLASEVRALLAERADLKAEIAVSDLLLNERQKVLDALPECPAHGSCIPHAIEYIADLAKDRDRLNWLADQGDECRWMNILRVETDDFESLRDAIDAAMQASQ